MSTFLILSTIFVLIGSLLTRGVPVSPPSVCGNSPNLEKYQKLLRNSTASSRIWGGEESTDGDWPFIVFVRFSVDGGEYACTGSIIHPRWVLTALHCQVNEDSIISYGSIIGEQGRQVGVNQSIPFLPECNPSEGAECVYNNDMRLVELAEPLEFDDSVGAICLTSELLDEKAGDKNAAAGFGATQPGTRPGTLRETVIKLHSRSFCRGIPDRMFCAGDIVHDVYHGDSGGPVMTVKNGKWYQHGVVTGGYEIGGVPQNGIFMRVSEFCSWIVEKTEGDVKCD